MSEEKETEVAEEQGNTETTETEETQSSEEVGLGEDAPEKKPDEATSEVPENYDLKAPEGVQLGEDDLKRIAEIAKDRGLTQEQAELLVKDEADHISRQMERFSETTQAWLEEAKADPEIGGANYNLTLKRGNAVLDRYADVEFKKVLVDSGLGRHVGLMKMLNRIGKAMENDRVLGKVALKPATPKTPDTTESQRMFPNSPMNP